MITHVRTGIWETNSSTMNQIAIHSVGKIEYKNLPEFILIDDKVDYNSAATVFDLPTKVKILYCMIQEAKDEAQPNRYYNFESDDDALTTEYYHKRMLLDAEFVETLMFRLLNKHNIKYEIDPNSTFEVGVFGLDGAKELMQVFEYKWYIEKFLFDDKSGFTFGYENAWPDKDRVGYTDILTSDSEGEELYDVILV